MNKSKFLKRPLAALLAILMVVALVPMNAFAAEPDVIKVGGVEATLSGDAYTVSMSVPSGTSGVVENALRNVTFELRTENGTKVGIINKDGAQNTTSLQGQPGTSSTRQSVDLLAYANKPEGSYWGDYTGIQLKVTTNDGVSTTYPLTITVSERNASSDTTIASVESTRIVAAEVDNTAKTIVITKPVGRDSTAKVLGLTKDNFKTTSPNADVNIGIADPDNDSITKVVVTAEDKSTQVYTVSYKVETIFDVFNVPDMISYEENEDNDTGDVIITVKVPFGTFGATSHIVPTFKPSENVKYIESTDGFTDDGGLYDRDNGQTTSGVADWSASTDTTAPDNGDKQVSFELGVQTGKSSLADTSGDDANGTVTVNFVPVANPAAKLTGVNVGDTNGADTYSQGLIEVANNVTSPTIIVGNIPNENLVDNDNNNNDTDVVELTTRDIKLHVSKNAKVTVMNPWADNVDTVYDDSDDHDSVVTLDNVNLRKYHSKPMEILVEAEDGAYNHATRYYLTFNGTPSGKPVINSVVLHSSTLGDVKSTKDKDGNIIIHVPYDDTLPTGAYTDLASLYEKMTVDASNGATTAAVSASRDGKHYLVAENSDIAAGGAFGSPAGGNTEVGIGHYGFLLHSSYANISADGSACTPAADESITKVAIIIDDANDKADITSLTLTDKQTLLEASTSKFPTTINPDEKTIRVEVPYDFGMATGSWANQDMYVYSWNCNGTDISVVGTAKSTFEYVVSNLDTQTATKLVTLDEDSITTVAGEAKYNPKTATTGEEVKVWSEKDAAGNTASPTETYYVYAVRQNASGESKLNNVTATAPVRVALDTTVDKLNRYIITIPKDYNSTTGIGNAKEFELTFDRSEKSTVVNGQRTWVGKDDTSAKFKVADGKLYFNNEQVTLTDGRIIHFTVVAENGTSTGEYEFVVVEGEASKDATLKSVKVDDEISFTQDDDKFIVEDLSENENYDVTKLPVVIETNDPGATVTVDGKDYIPEVTTVDLSEGKTAEVVVTAADEVTTATYTLSMKDGSAPVEKPSDKYDLSDVYSGHLEDVKKAIDMGLMSGTGAAGKFNPKGKIARQDFALIIARA
ncbi:cadherin-like beta sandwich domain-containing protein, partial [Acutalibacter sp. 1XD8-36]|uniref:cadherin-like beta sandwich domain-containing protein n=1 Tax=Acutalibacter sp. 1XD8-36 TaxID=2320852 RepID=UPI001412A851